MASVTLYRLADLPKLISIISKAAGDLLAGGPVDIIIEKHVKKLTRKQQGALHVWCGMVADTFNDAGIVYGTRVKFNGQNVSIDWNMKLVKDDVYKPMLEAMTGKSSTMDQDTAEPSNVALELTRHFIEKHGLTLPPWPSLR